MSPPVSRSGPGDEGEGGRHRPDRVRTGRADSDLEHLEVADSHDVSPLWARGCGAMAGILGISLPPPLPVSVTCLPDTAGRGVAAGPSEKSACVVPSRSRALALLPRNPPHPRTTPAPADRRADHQHLDRLRLQQRPPVQPLLPRVLRRVAFAGRRRAPRRLTGYGSRGGRPVGAAVRSPATTSATRCASFRQKKCRPGAPNARSRSHNRRTTSRPKARIELASSP